MIKYREKRINKILTITIVILMLFILVCGYELKLIREDEQRKLAEIREKIESKENNEVEVIYNKEVFGSDFELVNLEEYTTLDEIDNLKFIRANDMFFILDDEGALKCEYLYDEKKDEYNYRYCDVKVDENTSYRVDFASMKFIKE